MSDNSSTAQDCSTAEEAEPGNHFGSELSMPIWSVVNHETVSATGLTYDEAAKLASKLAAEKVAGLCIVTDEAGRRVSKT